MIAAMASPRSIEVKVGLLILVAAVLLAGFILVMGGINFQPTYDILVGFDNPGGLQGGAPVKIAGVKVGKINEMTFTGGTDDKGQAVPLVLARIAIEQRYQKNIHDNATFYITAQGVLGEQFLAIDPGTADRPVLEDGAMVRGLDPPRLDRLLAEAYDLLHSTVSTLREHKPQLHTVLDGLAKTLKGTGTFMENNQDRLDRIAANVEGISEEGLVTIKDARARYVNNPQIDRIMDNVEHMSSAGAQHVPLLLADSRELVGTTNNVVQTLGSDEELKRIKGIISDAQTTMSTAKLAVADARDIAAHIKRGRGSVGALIMDEQLFDDLQEMARDLKHNPWKFFWKE